MSDETPERSARLPDLLAANTSLRLSADDALTARGSEWVLLTPANRGRNALLIGVQSIIALHFLALRYEKVSVCNLSTNADPAWQSASASLAIPHEMHLLAPDDLWQCLDTNKGCYQLIVIEAELRRLLSQQPDRSRSFLQIVASALSPDGQCCVISNIRPLFAGFAREGAREQSLSLRQLKRTVSVLPQRRMFFPYPDNVQPQEILGWSTKLPRGRRNVFARGMDKLGLIESMHSATVVVGGPDSQKLLLQSIADEACQVAGIDTAPVIHRCLARDNGTVTVMLDAGLMRSCVLRVPLSAAAEQRLLHAWSGLQEMRLQLSWLSGITPAPLSRGEFLETPYFLESQCAGVTAASLGWKPKSREMVWERIPGFLVKFGALGEEPAYMSADTLDRCIVDCFDPIRRYSTDLAPSLDTVLAKIRRCVHHQQVVSVRVHGDFNPGNVLCNPSDGSVVGVIDWDACQSAGLPLQDIVHFVIDQRRNERQISIGDAIVEAVSGELFATDELESRLLKQYRDTFEIDDELNTSLLILYWLRHICLHIVYRNGPLPERWLQKNLYRPLEHFRELDY